MTKKILTGLLLLAIIIAGVVLVMTLTNEEDIVPPEVRGVETGVHNEPVTPIFNEGTALLNGEKFSSGTTVAADGTFVLEVTDDSGNTTTREFTIDQTAPEAPAVEEVDDQTENVTGKAEADSKVKVWSDEELLAVGSTDADGAFSLPITPQPAGSTVFVAAIDEAGNQSGRKEAQVRDVTAPSAPEVAEVSDQHTTVKGQAESGATVFVYTGEEKLAQTEAENGEFSAAAGNLAAGDELALHAVDDAGNKSETVTVTVRDRTAPPAPEVKAVTEETATLSGNAEPGATVQVFAGDSKLGETTANSNGAFEVDIGRQANGTELAVTATDAAGNRSEVQTMKVTGSGGAANPGGGNRSAVEPTYIDGILVVNKKYGLPQDYAPGINPTAQSALNRMIADAAAAGHELSVISTYRSYSYQAGLYNRYVSSHGEAQAKRFAAQPGHSEHQTGLAFDLGGTESQDDWLSGSFGDTPAGKWLAANAHKYGFIVRYPEGKEAITGYMYEPWHFRYLGVETATEVYNSGLTLEEYLGISGS
ncbi:Ig-like domain-containing protein [Planococcus salinarum]|uniref:Ig-like domain-containing protein n=1 Tax=Planococcus salinarum TaxID=622695 RepID=UPI000E3EACAA|nr:Ig-like domain-containing protein [Planococcus salinarum]TAA72816.1 D-alanyl-D-alanine carboxypeptidase family protein [Planococcus salinarum]